MLIVKHLSLRSDSVFFCPSVQLKLVWVYWSSLLCFLMGAVRLLIHCKTKADQKLEQSECLCAAAELSANNL